MTAALHSQGWNGGTYVWSPPMETTGNWPSSHTTRGEAMTEPVPEPLTEDEDADHASLFESEGDEGKDDDGT